MSSPAGIINSSEITISIVPGKKCSVNGKRPLKNREANRKAKALSNEISENTLPCSCCSTQALAIAL